MQLSVRHAKPPFISIRKLRDRRWCDCLTGRIPCAEALACFSQRWAVSVGISTGRNSTLHTKSQSYMVQTRCCHMNFICTKFQRLHTWILCVFLYFERNSIYLCRARIAFIIHSTIFHYYIPFLGHIYQLVVKLIFNHANTFNNNNKQHTRRPRYICQLPRRNNSV